MAILWSKNGFITYAEPEAASHNVCLTYLENTDGQHWQLAKPTFLTVKLLESVAAPKVQQLKWSNLLTDLAVWDELGNFYILLTGVGLIHKDEEKKEDDGPSYELTSYNHTEMIYRDVVQPQAHTQCVAFEWLGIEKPMIVNKRATMDQAVHYEVGQHHFVGVTHPIPTKQACVALRQNGLVNIYYQGEHKVEYHKTSLNLAPDGSEGSVLFTKAAIGYAPDKIVVAAYDARSDRILVYFLAVEWGFLVNLARRQKEDPHFHTPKDIQQKLQPSVSCTMVKTIKPPAKTSVSPETLSLFLQHIHVFSPYHMPSTTDIVVSYECMDPVYSRKFTKMFRYNVEQPKLDMFGSEEFGVPHLQLKDEMAVPHLRLIERLYIDGLLFLVYESGQIDVIDRQGWGKVEVAEKAVIGSLLDCGFSLPLVPRSELLCVSPNAAGILYWDGELHFEPLRRQDHASTRPAAIAIAYMHATACYGNTCSDDLMVVLKSELDSIPEQVVPHMVDEVIAECHRSINFKLNSFGKESVDKLLLNPPLQKLLSVQLLLGETPHTNQTIKDMAWIVLNLRSTSFGIMFSLSSIYRQMSKKKPHEDSLADSMGRAECIILLIGSVKWLIDLIVYLNQELLQLAFSKSHQSSSRVNISNSVVLPVILGKVPRLFLMYALSSIGKTHEILKKIYKDLSESNKLYTPMKEALNRFFTVCNSLPCNLGLFENFLRECEIFVNKELTAVVGDDKQRQLVIEQELFCKGIVPAEILPIANALLERHTATLSRELRLSELYFYESNWIDVGIARLPTFKNQQEPDGPYFPTTPRLQYSENEFVDALRKIIISALPRIKSGGSSAMGQGYDLRDMIKKCTRCRAVALVADPSVFDSPNSLGLWTMVFQRTCICGSAWINCT